MHKQLRSVSLLGSNHFSFSFLQSLPRQGESADPLSVGGSVWLKNWSEINGEEGKNPRVGWYIGIYFALGTGSSALVVVQTLILWIFCSIEVGLSHRAAVGARLTLGEGIQETARKNGFRDIQIAHELF